MTLEHRQKHVRIFICAGIVAATLAAYEPIRHNNFVHYDDNLYITENPNVTGGITPGSVIWAFTKSHASNWHPLTWLSHMLDCEIYGLKPVGHHITNVLIHTVNGLLLFWLLTRMTGAIWASGFVAAVFALHPVHVESVAWAAERKDVLSGLFWILTILAYVRYTERPNFKRYSLVLLVFTLGLMCKPMVVTLPFVLLLLDWWPLERIEAWHSVSSPASEKMRGHKLSIGRLIAEKIPLLVLSAISSVVTIIAQRSGGAVAGLGYISLDCRIANAFISYISYIGKTIWPSGLAVPYPYPHKSISDAVSLICILLFVLMTAISVHAGRRKKYILVGWLWYVGTLVPVLGLVQVGEQGMADRYMYLPMLGLLIITAWFVKDVVSKRPCWKVTAAILAVAILSSMAAITRTQVRYWQDDLTLFEHALKITKDNPVVENNYGCALSKLGFVDEAQKHLQNALRINPAYSEARNNLVKIYLKKGMLNEMIACFNEIIRRNEATADTYYNLAAALEMQKKYDEAAKYYAKSLEMNPEDPAANKRMGIALLAAGKTSEALGYAKRACELTGDKDAECLDALSSAFAAAGKFDEATRIAEKALKFARETWQEDLAIAIENRIKLYEAGQPYREK